MSTTKDQQDNSRMDWVWRQKVIKEIVGWEKGAPMILTGAL